MEELLRAFLESSHGLVAYASVFGVLVACGLGVPLPEDISLLVGGFLVHRGAATLASMMAVGFLGILCGDSIIFLAGRRFGSRVGRKPGGFFSRIITPEKRVKVEGMFARHGQKIVMVARFLPGVRAVTYFTAGSAGMSFLKFIVFDGIAALASAPLLVYLGYHFGGELELLVEQVRKGQLRVIGAIALVVLAYLALSRLRSRRRPGATAQTVPAAPAAAVPAPAHSYEPNSQRYPPAGDGVRAAPLK